MKSKGEKSVQYVVLPCFLNLLVNVRQLRVIPVPVAFQVKPVLSFVVWVGSLLKPPEQWEDLVWAQHLEITKGLNKYIREWHT